MEQTNQYQQPQQRASNGVLKTVLILITILMICATCGFLGFVMLAAIGGEGTSTETFNNELTYTHVSGNKESKNKIALIYVDQPILTAAQDYDDSLLNALVSGQYIFGYRIKDELVKLAGDSEVMGVLLVLNSPGGTIAGARAISDGVSYYREKTGNPVYAYVQDMAASGAYWSAVSTDKIYAEQGSLVGSIGVIMGPFEYYDKLIQMGNVGTANGITITYITAGKSKDLGNPTRKITDVEMKTLQDGINTEYEGFVSYVSKQRNIPEETIKTDIGAMIFGAKEAKDNKMIDEIGNWDTTVSELAKKAGVDSDYKVVKISKNVSLFGGMFSKFSGQKNTVETLKPANTCMLCNKMLYLHGSPEQY